MVYKLERQSSIPACGPAVGQFELPPDGRVDSPRTAPPASGMEFATHLETERLRLRPLTAADTAFVVELIADERVRQFLGGPVPEARRAATAQSYLSVDSGEATWLVETKVAHRSIGLVFISNHKDGTDLELSFMFSPSAWGVGYATEAAQRLLNHATHERGIVRLIAETQSANMASRSLCERLGMSEERRTHRFGAEQIIYAS